MSTNSALLFDGLNDYVTIPQSAALNTNTITVEAWIKGTPSSSWSKIIGKGPDSSEVFGLYLTPNSGTFRVESQINGSQRVLDSGIAVGDNNWHHIAYSYDGTNQILYVDGIQRAIASISGTLTSNSQPISIGREVSSSTNQYGFNGTIDEVRIWNVARTQAQIQGNMSTRLTGTETGLISYWNLDQGSGGTIEDLTSNNNDGSLGGGTPANQPAWVTSYQPNTPEVVSSFYRNTVLFDNPIAYWALDELAWPVAVDSSGNGKSGSYLNGVTLGGTGSVGQSASFDGVNDTVEIPINSPETNYTYELWFKTAEATGGISSVRQGINSSDDRDLFLKNGNIYHRLWSEQTINSTGKNYGDNQWHHVAVVVQSGVGQKIYVDSELVASGSKGESNFNWDTYIALGKAYDPAGAGFGLPAFKGSIDEVALYNTALSADEITKHYRARSVVQTGTNPDLTVDNIGVPATVVWGQTIPVTWKVTNQGSAAATASWSDQVFLSPDTTLSFDDRLLGTFTASSQLLENGGSYTQNQNIVVPYNINPNQSWYLLVGTDVSAIQQVETNKDNNVQSVALNLSLPDLLYFNNFEGAIASEWKTTSATDSSTISPTPVTDNSLPSSLTKFLGRFGGNRTTAGNATLSLNTTPGQTYRLEFDFYAIDSWDGTGESDRFKVLVDGSTVFNESFNNVGGSQSFRSPDQSGNLGYISYSDSIYRRIPIVFTATGATTQIKFLGDTNSYSGTSALTSDESWGIDNVKVWTVDPNAESPDLIVSSITPPNPADMNGNVTLSWTVTNQGTGKAVNSWLDRVYLSQDTLLDSSDTLLGNASAANLTPLTTGTSYVNSQSFTLPTNVIGDWYVLVATDGFNTQTETNEGNNLTASATKLHIKAPDLVVTGVTAPETAPERSSISLSWTVTNQGEAIASTDWYDYVFLSDNTTLDGSDRSLGYVWTSDKTPLAAGASYTINQNLSLPGQIGAGKQYLLFVADRNGYQTEASETNNVRAVAINLTVPDLVTTDATAPIAVTVGSTADVSWTVLNQGNVQATHLWYDRVYLSDDQTLDNSDTQLGGFNSGTSGTALAAGSNYTLTKTLNIPNTALGNRYLLFVADADNYQYETNDNNNVKAIPVEVKAPDLITTAASAPATAGLGDQITVNWAVKNQGDVVAGADWYDYFFLSDDAIYDSSDQSITYKWTGAQTPLASNASYSDSHTFNIPTNAKAGSRYLLVVADRDNYQKETNENNNTYAVSITIKAPDLTVTDATPSASSATPGASLSVSYTVKNQGEVSANQDWYDRVFLSLDDVWDSSDTYLNQRYTSTETPLAAGATYSVNNLGFTLPGGAIGQAGNRYLLVVTDALNYQSETNDNNNVKAIPLTITGSNADLTITTINAPTNVSTQQNIAVSWTGKNIGNLATTASYWYDRVYISSDATLDASDTYLNETYGYRTLTPGQEYNLGLNVTIPQGRTGTQYLLVVADNYNYQGEISETNNVKALQIDVKAPDLQITSATAPSLAYAGAQIEVTWNGTNQGNSSAIASWYDSVYLSDDAILNTSSDTLLKDASIGNLAPLANGTGYTVSQLISLPTNLTQGNKYLIFAADRGSQQGELDESNNLQVVPITIGAPDSNLSLVNTGSPVQNQTNPPVVSNPNPAGYATLAALPSVGGSGTGLLGQYYVIGSSLSTYPNFDSLSPTYIKVDPQVDFSGDNFAGIPGLADTFGVRWTGKINITTPGNVTFFTASDDGSRLYVDGQLVVNNDGIHGFTERSGVANLTAGEHDLRLDFFENYGGQAVTLSYTPVGGSKQVIPTAVLTPATLSAPAEDLKISGVTTPTVIGRGQTIATNWTVTNQGSTTSQGLWSDQVYLSDDTIIDGTDTRLAGFTAGAIPLGANSSYTQTQNLVIPTNIGLGNKYLIFATNPDKPESDRTNNAYAVPVVISNPDLIVSTASTPTVAAERASITVNWTVQNQGDVPAIANWYDSVYLSNNTVFDSSDLYMGDLYITGGLAVGGTYSKQTSFALPEKTGSGKWYVLVVADRYNNYQQETSDTNNVYALPINITVPDLTVTNATAPTTAAVSESVSVSWTVQNIGDVTAAADWYDYVYVSDDTTLDAADTLAASFYHSRNSTVATGGSYVSTQNITIPNSSSLGDRYLLFVSDRNNNQSETNETNNVYATPIKISVPDLVVSAANAPIAATIGDSVSVSWTVSNQGSVVAATDWYDSVYLSDDTIFDSSDQYITDRWTGDKTPLAASSNYSITQNITIPGNAKAGNRYVLFIADRYNNYQKETNENNNTYALPITIKAPDLTVTDATPSASSATPGASLSVSYTVKNQGEVSANQDWYDRVLLSYDDVWDSSDTYLNQRYTSTETPLAAGATYSVNNLGFTLPGGVIGQAGNRYLLVVTDALNYQSETNDNNNVKAIPLTITGSNADLTITTINAPTNVSTQQNIAVSWTGKNIGNLATTASYWHDRVYISSDGTLDASDTYLSETYGYRTLTPGQEYNLGLNVTIPQGRTGTQYLLVVADNYNYQGEISETNNVQALQIQVAAPDLVVTSATAPVKSYPGSRIEVSWTVTNQGNAVAPQDWTDKIYLSNDAIFDAADVYLEDAATGNFTPLKVGDSYTTTQLLTLPNNTQTGSRYLLFVADQTGVQGESNESNNVTVVPIVIGDQEPDLTVTAASAPATAVLGEGISVNWTVKNQGTLAAAGTWYDSVYLSDDTTLDASDLAVSSGTGQSPLDVDNTYSSSRNIVIPNTTIGSKYLLFVTDAGGQKLERDETNNLQAVPIILTAPDLVVTAANTSVSAATWGESIQATWTVTNQGTVVAAANWADQIYLSDDLTLDGTDRFITSLSAASQAPLAAGGNYTQNLQITIPTNSGTGSKYLLFVADANDAQGETDNSNNVKATAITIKAPDLAVSAATIPTSAALNETVAVSWTVTNQGDGTASADWYDYVYISNDQVLDNSDTSLTYRWAGNDTPLTAGSSYTATQNITIPNVGTGNKYLLFVADRDNNQSESNETNNVKAVQIDVTAPELVVSAATTPTSAALNETVAVSWTVTNQGNGTASVDWYDYVYISNDEVLDNSDTYLTNRWAGNDTPLAVGASYTATQNITIPNTSLGNRYLLFVADRNNNQSETNETNNVRAVGIDITATDLVVSAATVPTSAALNETVAVSWTVTNQGTSVAPADWYDYVYISDDQTLDNSDTYLTNRSAGNDTPLAAGASYTATQNITIPNVGTGNKYLLFVADRNNNQGETNESNNVRAITIDVTAPDLVVSAATTPASGAWGETVALSWTVTNQGDGTAPADWYDYVYISNDQTLDNSDTYLTNRSAGNDTPLAAGASYTATQNITIPNVGTGNKYLLFVADRNNNQGETNESNNVRAITIDVTAPDLVVSAATTPASAALGETVALSWTVTNQGNGAALADWYDYVYISDDQVLDNSDTYLTNRSAGNDTPLAVGASYTVNQNVTLPNTATGSRYLLFVADRNNNQGETNETNNVQAVAINLNAPDLVVSSITAPVEALSGQQIEIAWTITNQGNADATGTWTDNVYLSNDGTIGGDRYINAFSFTGTIAAGASIERRQFITTPIDTVGNYRVVISTDANNQLPEGTGNEANNTSIDDNSTQIRLAPIPNLQVSSVTAPPTAFSSQETVVQWTVTNNGTGATSAPFWYDNVWLSLDNTLDNTDTYLGQASNVSYLNVGESYTNSLTAKLPRGIDSNYYFLVKTDANNNVFEFDNENDNFGVGGPTDVDLTPPPDFQVTAVNAPAQGFSGQPLNLTWTVTNQGTGKNLETSWYDEVFMSADDVLDGVDRSLGKFYRSGTLNAGTGYNVSQTVTLPIGFSGDFFFFVRTDAGNQVYENVFESNNTGYDTTATKINLTPPPDLEVEFVDAPATASASRPLTINYRVTNFGATATPNSSWTDTFYLSTDTQLDPNTDLKLGERGRFGTLDIGASYDNSATFTLPNGFSGTYYAFVVTDSTNTVFELNNDNNVVFDTTAINIASLPGDLVVTDVTTPSTVEAGKALTVNWTVTNQGTGDTVVSSWVDRVYVSTDTVIGNGDDVLLSTFTRNGLLNVGGSYSRSELVGIPFNLVGNYQLFVVTDSNNNVYEVAGETNNSSTPKQIAITRQTPDLQVVEVSGNSQTGLAAEPVTVNWTVKNFGSGQTNVSFWYDAIYLSSDQNLGDSNDIYLGRVRRSNSLAVGDEYEASATFTAPLNAVGNFYTIVRTDSDNQVLEDPLENNNNGVSVGTISIAANTNPNPNPNPTPNQPPTNLPPEFSPDLVVTGVNAPETGISGQSFEVSWTVQNNRYSTGNRSWYDAVYLSRDQVFDRSTDIYLGIRYQSNLAAGESYTATQSFSIPRGLSGPFYVFAVTDGGNNINESDRELNNIGYDGNSTEISLSQPADLVVGTITIPANGVPGQNATISYTVNNQGQNPALGSWSDSIYISADNQWDVNDALFGRVQHFGDVASGGSYSKTLTAALPGLLPGDYYAIVRSDIRNQISESNESNNITASLNQFAADAERLDLGTADTGSLGQGQAAYYRVDVAAGETLRVKFDSASTTAANELYIRYGDVPSRNQFDFGFSDVLAADQDILVPTTRSGTYYILAYGASVGGTPANYSIEADVLGFEILDIGTKRGSNLGQTTITISGSKFSTDDVVSLVAADGTQRTASRVWWKNSTELWATFDLQGLTTGLYDVKVENGAQTATLDDAFTVSNGAIGNLTVSVDAPSALRPGQAGVVTVNYANTGETDIVAPLLTLVAENANLRLPEQTESVGSSLQFLGINSQGPAGIIAPGASGSFSLLFNPTVNDGSVTFSVSQAANDQTIDWDSLKNQARPNNISNEGWNVIWQNFITSVGNKAGTYKEILADNANHLSLLGEYTNDAIRLLGFELQQVSNSLIGSNQGNSIDQRFNTGTFGRAGVNEWDIKVTPDSNGDVTLFFGNSPRLFTKQSNGNYQGQPGDNATLTLEGGIYRLREEDGSLIAFRLDGKFDYIEDTNQNRVTANYADGKLTRLVHSDGNYLEFSYNAQGLVSQTTDQDNWTTTYEYDTTGEYLLSITTPDGTTSYTYETNSTSGSQHAIKSVRFSDNTGLFYEYDNQGRLIKQSLDGNAEPITYSYDSSGGVTITDASGAVSKLLYNDRGTLGRIEDPLKRITQYQYDSNGNLTKLTAADNTVSTFTYDNLGNIISSVNALGQQIKYTYETKFNQLASVRDQRGNPLNYSYDSQGNLQQITYADGSKETFSYDATGNVTVAVNRRNQNISYTYNSDGLLTRKYFADGTSATYTYDSRGNLLTAIDSDSSVTYTYDSLDRLTKVSYGADRFLEFTYDSAGRRSRMVDKDGFTTNYSYDTLGRLKSLTDATGANIISYTYDNVGRLSREDNGNGTYTTYSYDLAGQLLSLVNYESNGTVNSRFDYTYDNAGRRTSTTTLEGTTTYGYDSIGQLTLVNLPNGRIIEYQYDAAGNRIKVKDSGVETAYSTNNLNQYTSVGAATYNYDTDGNLISKTQGGNTWSYSYDSENRLIGAVTPEGNWSYEYDALGNRIASILNGQRTEYLLDPTGLGDVVGEYGGNGDIIARYTHGLGLVSRVDGTNAASYYDADAIGSIVGLTGADGDYLNQYSYLPFGESLSTVEAVSNPFEYVGQWGVMREGNSLDFMRARFYSSLEGRFLTPDSLGISGGINLYEYAVNDPLNTVDIDGLSPVKLFKLFRYFKDGTKEYLGSYSKKEITNKINSLDKKGIGNQYGVEPPSNVDGKQLAKDLGGGRKPVFEIDKKTGTPHWHPNDRTPATHIEKTRRGSASVELLSTISTITGALTLPYWANKYFPDKPWVNIGAEILDFFNPLSLPQDILDLWDLADEIVTDIIRPSDPNDILGPAGFGEEKWITASSTLPYTIRFENQATATAPAQQVVITQQLDPDLDFRTYRVGDFGWGDLFFDVPDNRAFYNQRLDLTATKGYYVDVSAGIDVTTGEAFWTITTIDPNTGEIPEDALAGFLPPNNEDGVGDGFVNYNIRAKRNVETGAVIDAEARIVFDTEEPIDTPPIFNTLDAGTPNSTVNVLPATSQPGEILVTWSGSDDSNGSALANYTIYVSDNGADFTPWLENTTLTEANYIGEAGHTYAFYSVARDNAGNTEAAPSTADAQTTIPGSTILGFGAATYSINEDGTPVTAVTINRDGSNGTLSATLTLANGTATAPADYDNTPITVNFADGETSKTVAIPIVNDAVAEGNETFTLNLGTSSDYQLGDISTTTVTIIDNDTAGVTIIQSGGTTNVTEGGATDTYTVALTSQPTADVNIALANTQTATNVNTLTFTAANWNIAQPVTVTAVDDAVIEGNHSGVITHIATSSDTNYNGINIGAVNVNITDNDFNVITGNTSNPRDPLTGTVANDRIVGGAGAKTITGGLGNDEFVYTNLRDVGQRIADFTVGEDKIVLTQLLSSIGYQGTNPINDGYVQFIQGSTANSTVLQIDRDGPTGSAIFRNFLQLDNVTPSQINSVDNFVF
ncbi:MAG: CARDB domain-containing protein [Gloeotrichia echinulata DEX184]|nr:type I secretion C-terminal target domain-containing protein [Gloeotrichia echinulata DEX184]